MSAMTQSSESFKREARVGVLGGLVGALVMAMYAMIVSATVKDVGFFTPMYHIASAFISPKAMMRSMAAAAHGDEVTFIAGPALFGLVVHMMTGAIAGGVFGAAVSALRVTKPITVAAGVVFGLLVLVVNSFIGLPIVASLFGGGDPIRHMPKMVGWGTFTTEHVLYGLTLGLVVAAASRTAAVGTANSTRMRVSA